MQKDKEIEIKNKKALVRFHHALLFSRKVLLYLLLPSLWSKCGAPIHERISVHRHEYQEAPEVPFQLWTNPCKDYYFRAVGVAQWQSCYFAYTGPWVWFPASPPHTHRLLLWVGQWQKWAAVISENDQRRVLGPGTLLKQMQSIKKAGLWK